MPPTITHTIRDLQGLVASWRRWIEVDLGFDQITVVEISIREKTVQISISAEDKFQSKRDHYSKIGRLSIFEINHDLDLAIEEVWRLLSSHMRKDERELRFALAQLGDSIEGDQFVTEVGRLMHGRLKAVRDDISAKYLPRYERGREVAAAEAPPLEHPAPQTDDEILF